MRPIHPPGEERSPPGPATIERFLRLACVPIYAYSSAATNAFWHLRYRLAIFIAMSDLTRILSQMEQGDPHAAEKLLPLVYDELRILAAAKLAQEKPGQTLQATALVHEAYLRLIGGRKDGGGVRSSTGGERDQVQDPSEAPSFRSSIPAF